METGRRANTKESFTTIQAIDVDFSPPGTPSVAYQIIDITINFNTAAPTSSENITFNSVENSVTVLEHSFDPSLSTLTSHVFRFDKRFAKGTVFTIDYVNTDASAIDVLVRYQLDASVD